MTKANYIVTIEIHGTNMSSLSHARSAGWPPTDLGARALIRSPGGRGEGPWCPKRPSQSKRKGDRSQRPIRSEQLTHRLHRSDEGQWGRLYKRLFCAEMCLHRVCLYIYLSIHLSLSLSVFKVVGLGLVTHKRHHKYYNRCVIGAWYYSTHTRYRPS